MKKQNKRTKNHLPGTREMAQSVPSTSCSCRVPRVSSQKPQGLSQLSVMPVPGNQTPSSGFHGYCTHTVHMHTFRQTLFLIYIYIKSWRLPNQKQSLPFLNTNTINTPQTKVMDGLLPIQILNQASIFTLYFPRVT